MKKGTMYISILFELFSQCNTRALSMQGSNIMTFKICICVILTSLYFVSFETQNKIQSVAMTHNEREEYSNLYRVSP